jgi:hypothetical protein
MSLKERMRPGGAAGLRERPPGQALRKGATSYGARPSWAIIPSWSL